MVEKTRFTVRHEKCANCYFFEMISKTTDMQEVFICRKTGPHTSAALIATPGPNGPVPQWLTTTYWDRVSATDWCGNFRDKEAN